jgi:dihydrofolate reductase
MSSALEPLAMVVAMTKNRVIGRAGKIPWDLPEDRKHFVEVTRGHAIIMGRGTWDSIGRPLPKRRNIVVSRNPKLSLPGVEVSPSLSDAIALARQTDPEPRVMGGGVIYAEALPITTRIYLTLLDYELEGDAFFPELNPEHWQCKDELRTEHAVYRTLERH